MSRSPLTAALALLAAVSLTAAVTLGVLLVLRAGPSAGSTAVAGAPSDGSLDAGFARDMQVHHRQAVTMSLLLLERTDDPATRSLASDILLTQQQQAGQMHGWLEVWGLPQTGSQPVMAWMDHGAAEGHGAHAAHGTAEGGGAATGVAAMPGMASAADLQRLRESTGTDAERLYLQLMVPHHEAGVQMADAALAESTDPAVRALAGAVSASQTSELAVLGTLLAERGGPLPG